MMTILRKVSLKNSSWIAAFAALAALTATPTHAATTIFGASVYSQSGPVTNAGDALGVSNGAGALVGGAGELVLQFVHPLTGAGISFDLLPITGINVVAISVGEVISGVATFSAGEFVAVDMGAGGTFTPDLTALCATVSASGCSLVRFRNAGALMGSTGFLLDGVSGVTDAPEPSIWALLILGFAFTSWRVKKIRKPYNGRLSNYHTAAGIACA